MPDLNRNVLGDLEHFPPKREGAYKVPTDTYFGRGALKKLPEILELSGAKKVFFLFSQRLRKDPFTPPLFRSVGSDFEIFTYDEALERSDFKTVNAVTAFARKNGIDVVVAIGGGTVLDIGKCVAALAPAGGTVEEYVQSAVRNLKARGLYFIAIPTTAGTGSEVTPWATVWGNDMKKYSLSSPSYIFPGVALVDPSLTDSLPREQTAMTGVDALTQAIEAYWNVNHNPISDQYALKAIFSIVANIKKTVDEPVPLLRDAMAKASLFSGLAFSNTQTTICHSVSYPITSHWNVPHGQAVAVTLPIFFEYIASALPAGRKQALLTAVGAKSENDARKKLEELLTSIGLKIKLSELGVPQSGIPVVAEEGHHSERTRNSPRIPTRKELENMLYSIF